MTSKTQTFSILVALIVGALLGTILNQTDSLPLAPDVSHRKYALNVMFSTWPGWQASSDTLKRIADATPGLKVVFGGPPDGDPGKQIEEFESLITQKVNGIIVHAGDPKSLKQSVDKATASGIPVVTFFGDVDNSSRLTFISGDERASARRLMEKVLKAVSPPEGGKFLKVVASYPKPGITCSEDRLSGVRDALASISWAKLVEVVSDEASDSKGAEAISAAWQRHNGVDLIIGLGGRSAIGAISALKELNVPKGKVFVTGWDADKDVLRGIKDGWLYAVSVPNFGFMVELGVETLEAYNLSYQGNKSPKFPVRVEVEQHYVDKNNVDEFMKDS